MSPTFSAGTGGAGYLTMGMPYHHFMSEADAVALSTDGPVTRAWLVRDLRALGVAPGMLLLAHCSLSRLGWVCGGAVTVVAALREVLGAEGTLAMPAFSGDNSDPSQWRHPGVPESWWDVIRESMPAYSCHSPLREMGAVAEYFLHLPGVLRSASPGCSWAAQGPLAQAVTDGHSLDYALGEHSPLARCYDLGGFVLSLGTARTTVLHLAEYRADYPGKRFYTGGSAVLTDGQRRWMAHEELHGNNDDFEALRLDFMRSVPPGPDTWREGSVAYHPTTRLFAVRPLVDYAVGWMEEHRLGQ